MIVCVSESGHLRTHTLKENQVRIPVLDSHICFILHHHEYLMKLPHNLTADMRYKICHEAEIRVTSNTCLRSAVLMFSGCDEGYDVYEYYEADKPVLIGSGIDDDIYVQSSLASPASLQIIPAAGKIIVYDENIYASRNGEIIRRECGYQTDDILEFINIRIIFHEDFIMVNTCSDVYVSLPPYRKKKYDVLPEDLRELRYVQYPFSPDGGQYEETIRQPERIPRAEERMLILSVGPSLMMASAAAAAAGLNVYFGYMNGREPGEMASMLIFPLMMIISSLIWIPLQKRADKTSRRKRMNDRDREYEAYIERVIRRASEYYEEKRKTAEICFPRCADLYETLQNQYPRIVIRDTDGLFVRLGTSFDLIRPVFGYGADPDEMMKRLLKEKTEAAAAESSPLPFIADLCGYRRISIRADSEYIRYLLIQIFLYYPREYAAALLAGREELPEWYWLFHFPQFQNSGVRCIAVTEIEAGEIRNLLRVNKGTALIFRSSGTELSVSDEKAVIIDFNRSGQRYDAVIQIENGKGMFQDFIHHRQIGFTADRIPAVTGGISIPASSASFAFSDTGNGFFDLYEADSAKDIDIEERWLHGKANDGLKCFLGFDGQGRKIVLDLHESGCGPHGLIAGTTGSGKSEMLITMILSLAVNYPPDQLRIVLIDFKGGSLINAFHADKQLPHLAGVLTNLDVDDMKRALVSIGAECRNRERLLKKMSEKCGSSVMDACAYRRYRKEEYGLPVLPDLLIVIDEFAELKRDRPDFMDELISAARIGRSLGIHLILCTQKPGGIVNDQIRSNVRFRICLKVAEKQDSQEMIQSDDAYFFPKAGMFALFCDGILKKGTAGYANAEAEKDRGLTEIYDCMGNITAKHTEKKEKGISQLRETLGEICAAAAGYDCGTMLWLNELKHVSRAEAESCKNILAGKADDYYRRRYSEIVISPEEVRTAAVFSSSVSEKENFLRALLFGFMKKRSAAERIFIIDDLRVCRWKKIIDVKPVIDIFEAERTDKTEQLMKYLREGSHKTVNWLVITDYLLFCSAAEKNRESLKMLLENTDYLNICVIVFASGSIAMNYRDQQYFEKKIVLRSVSAEDAKEIMNTAERIKCGTQFSGIVRTDHLLPFVMTDITVSDLEEAAEEHIRKHGSGKEYRIPSMPDTVCFTDYRGQGFPLGISRRDYQWRAVGPQEYLVVICSCPEDFAGFFLYLRTMHAELKENPASVPEEPSFLLYTLAEFRRTSLQQQLTAYPVLYLGDDYEEQYIFSGRPGRINEGEGILIRRKKCEVIRLVERI